jgi:hypothetical protein
MIQCFPKNGWWSKEREQRSDPGIGEMAREPGERSHSEPRNGWFARRRWTDAVAFSPSYELIAQVRGAAEEMVPGNQLAAGFLSKAGQAGRVALGLKSGNIWRVDDSYRE